MRPLSLSRWGPGVRAVLQSWPRPWSGGTGSSHGAAASSASQATSTVKQIPLTFTVDVTESPPPQGRTELLKYKARQVSFLAVTTQEAVTVSHLPSLPVAQLSFPVPVPPVAAHQQSQCVLAVWPPRLGFSHAAIHVHPQHWPVLLWKESRPLPPQRTAVCSGYGHHGQSKANVVWTFPLPG